MVNEKETQTGSLKSWLLCLFSATVCKPHNLTEPHVLHLRVLDRLAPKGPLGFLREGQGWIVQRRKGKQSVGGVVGLGRRSVFRQELSATFPYDFSCDFTLSSSLLGDGLCLTQSSLHSVPVNRVCHLPCDDSADVALCDRRSQLSLHGPPPLTLSYEMLLSKLSHFWRSRWENC